MEFVAKALIIGKGLKEAGLPNEEIVSRRHRCFSVTCPKCGTRLDGKAFATCFLLWAEHGDSEVVLIKQDKMPDGQVMTTANLCNGAVIYVRGAGKAIRFYAGHCINESCISEQVIMRWASG
jgi:hypothetical protein